MDPGHLSQPRYHPAVVFIKCSFITQQNSFFHEAKSFILEEFCHATVDFYLLTYLMTSAWRDEERKCKHVRWEIYNITNLVCRWCNFLAPNTQVYITSIHWIHYDKTFKHVKLSVKPGGEVESPCCSLFPAFVDRVQALCKLETVGVTNNLGDFDHHVDVLYIYFLPLFCTYTCKCCWEDYCWHHCSACLNPLKLAGIKMKCVMVSPRKFQR